MPIGTLQHPEHTKYSTYQEHCTGSKFSFWGIKMTTTTKLVEFSFLSSVCLLVPLNVEVFVVVVVVGCVQVSVRWNHLAISKLQCLRRLNLKMDD